MDFNFDFDIGIDDIVADMFSDVEVSFEKTRYAKPPKTRIKNLKFEYAEELAEKLKIEKDCRYFCILSGNFILGDIYEAIATKQIIQYEKLTISTLSMSHDNVDSLKNLLMFNYCKKLDLIVSDYFYAHERNDIIKYIYQELDIDNRFQLAVAGTHTKIASFETNNGLKVVIHGSGNLRSSRSAEQISIEENAELYDFVDDFNIKIIEKYATIRKGIRASKLWEVVNNG
jgi:hypothetical protein